MSAPEPDKGKDKGKRTTPADAAAEADESGYRRDDYWRGEQGGRDPQATPEPPQGYRFAEEERRRGDAPDDAPGGDEHDRARIVDRNDTK